MEDMELKNLWQACDRKITEAQLLNAQSWALNLRCFENIQQQKAASKLNSLARFKTGAVILGILWVLFLGVLVWGNRFHNPYFGISASAIAIFSAYAVIVYIKHITLLRGISYDGAITDTQEKLSALQASTFQSTRILWLQLPFYTTWFWHSSWIDFSTARFWLINFPITLLFVLLAIYLYKNITAENLHKKWVRTLMMAGPEYKEVVKARAFLEEIETFKKELI